MALAVSSPLGTPLSSFGGNNDDERLAAYETERRNPNSPVHGWPVILDQPRVYTLNRPIAIDSGFCMVGSVRPVDQARGSKPIPNQLNLRMPSTAKGWLRIPAGQTFGVALIGLSIDANAYSRVFEPTTGVLWCSTLRDVSYQNGPGIMGSSAQNQPTDAITVEGWCNWNNIRDRAIRIGGSDSAIHPTKLLIDSPPTIMGPKGYLVQFTSLSKTDVSGFYLTAEQHSGILCDYTNEFLSFSRMHIEGRNAGKPCYGALVRLSCSFSQWVTSWFSYGMTNPAAGANPSDAGLIHCTNGVHEFDHCHTKRATGVPEDRPFIYGTGSGTLIRATNIVGEKYVGKPVVRVVNGARAECDDTVKVVQG